MRRVGDDGEEQVMAKSQIDDLQTTTAAAAAAASFSQPQTWPGQGCLLEPGLEQVARSVRTHFDSSQHGSSPAGFVRVVERGVPFGVRARLESGLSSAELSLITCTNISWRYFSYVCDSDAVKHLK